MNVHAAFDSKNFFENSIVSGVTCHETKVIDVLYAQSYCVQFEALFS